MSFSIRAPLVVVVTVVALAIGASAALAAESGPQWTVSAVSRPTSFLPEEKPGQDAYVATVTNTGGAATDGSPIAITDELPAALSLDPAGATGEDELARAYDKPAGADFKCLANSCTYTGIVVPGQTLLVTFPVEVTTPTAATVTNSIRVAGGGAANGAIQTPTSIGTTPAPFGISPGGAGTALSSTQAGAHPDITTSIAFNTTSRQGSLAGDPRETVDELPVGFAGADLVDTPSCPSAEFLLRECPVGTQVGVTTVTLAGFEAGSNVEPVYNLAPNPGEAAKIGFVVAGNIFVEGGIYLQEDNSVRVVFENINQALAELDNVSLTVWGVPADPIHDPLRWSGGSSGGFGAASDAPRVPFFTNPTACTGEQLEAKFTVNSWQQPAANLSEGMMFGPVVGCDRLKLAPVVTAELTTPFTSSATGLDVDTTIPQTYGNPEGLATSHLREAVVTLPEGMTVNPSAGAGLGACSPSELAQEVAVARLGVGCPNDSKLGTIRAKSPALAEEAEGSVFLAAPYENPFGSLLALYIVARIPNRGIIVKAAGEVHANAITGQLVTTFDTSYDPSGRLTAHDGLPQVPIETLTFKFRQGTTSPLVTPATCGSYEVKAALTPWSNPLGAPLTPPVPLLGVYNEGAGCPSSSPPFSPQVTAGTQNNAAGTYSPLELHITRNDNEQEITGLSSQLPAGLTANLTGVPFCSEAQIDTARGKTGAQEETEPSCPQASQIGHTLVGAGVGSTLVWTPGKIYLAGPYQGAPFSVAAITTAKVGPFDLGTVVVHLPLEINPETAQVSIPAGAADQIPHIIDGIVIHVRDIRVYTDRQDFTINPTNCNPTTLTATVIGGGANPTNPAGYDAVTVTDPFQAANCQNLKFEPKFTASTSGKTSKANGASLTVKLKYPTGGLGRDTNIARVKVDLPKQLPSRLTTLQKACTAAQFNANPAGCPAASLIGTAKAVTPILPEPLTGPAYFVSHGGEAFPSLEIVLQGYGVKIVLTGTTYISKAGITSSTFKTVPDQPVTSFELTLPEGKYSALAANGNLCTPTRTVTTKKTIKEKIHGKTKKVTKKTTRQVTEPLAMPTEFVGQNGTVLKGIYTPITVIGCAKKAAPAKKAKQKKKARGKKKK